VNTRRRRTPETELVAAGVVAFVMWFVVGPGVDLTGFRPAHPIYAT